MSESYPKAEVQRENRVAGYQPLEIAVSIRLLFAYGVYQMGLDHARSWIERGKSSGGSTPSLAPSYVD